MPHTPKRVVEIIEKVTWDCGNPDHNHTTEEVARACMIKSDKTEVGKRAQKDKQNQVRQRTIDIARDQLNNGMKYDAIKEKYGISYSVASTKLSRFFKEARKLNEKIGITDDKELVLAIGSYREEYKELTNRAIDLMEKYYKEKGMI